MGNQDGSERMENHMIQFTEQEILHLQEKAKKQPEVVEHLKQKVRDVFEGPVIVPKTGIANWILYYYCPKCSMELEFHPEKPHQHRCPSCGQVLTGEPYDSAWWGHINMKNYDACFQMALIYLLTNEDAYAKKAIAIMTEYAKYYKDYEVHGNIPYNGPGKAGAQTLDEANFQRTFAMTYDLLADCMTEEEKVSVRDGMLLPGAQFLVQHRHNQLHNHEVIINSAIAIIGLIFGRDDYIQFSVYEKYGILYQLEHAMLPNHMWFEGAFGYHFYALTSFFAYEKFALHTPHSHISHPNYKAMMELLFSYLEPGFRIPMLNDTNYNHNKSSLYLFEFAYREIGGEKLLYILNKLYEDQKRDNLEAFIYGVDELEPCDLPLSNYHTPVGTFGHTILRASNDRYLLFKHDSYGGEHDHYDRLAISYLAYRKRIAPDLGTTGYGAFLHYDYYKNTGSHNTVAIGGENQAPVNCSLNRYEEKDGVIYVEAEADWTAAYEMPDSFTIVQWNEENYRSVRMKRKIAWADRYFAEVFTVEGADAALPIDWIMHVSGTCLTEAKGKMTGVLSDKKPYKHIHDVQELRLYEEEYTEEYAGEEGAEGKDTQKCCMQGHTPQKTEKIEYLDDGIRTTVYSMQCGQKILLGMGPDNPSTSDVCYLIERRYGGKAVYAHVIESDDGENVIQDVKFEIGDDGCGRILVTTIGEQEDVKTKVTEVLEF